MKLNKTAMYTNLDKSTYSKENDQLGDLESTNKELIDKLRTLKCFAEMSGEALVLWAEPNQFDGKGIPISSYRRLESINNNSINSNESSDTMMEPSRQLSHDDYYIS